MNTTYTPLVGPPPVEVPLRDAPLIRVIGQVRFPLIASLEKRDFVGAFQEAIRADYPVLRPEQNRGISLGPQGVVSELSNTIWRFHDVNSEWRLSLAPDFLALETTRYISRIDFLDRFERVLEALRVHVNPGVIDRLGMRYIDRLVGENLKELPKLIRAEVAGVMGTSLAKDTQLTIAENVFNLTEESGQLKARWGMLPANATVDPSAIDAIGETSWILDLDAFASETRPFQIEPIMKQANSFAERLYSFFRWATTDEFLIRYGGQP